MNIPTLIALLIVAIIFVAIVANEIKKRKSGQGSCSCGCSGCGMADVCHGGKNEKKESKEI
ncbi:MAG: FeoB-associated Cys-rich membrane protein [Clostridia bacterium]|nr:FeoB-associated Cys-rich membrane protein [Clostridia bacterium]